MSDMLVKVLPYCVDLDKPIETTELRTLFVMNDCDAHRFELEILRGGVRQEIDDSFTVTGWFMSHQGKATLKIEGSAKDGKAVVTLKKACYSYKGQFSLIIQISKDDIETALFYGNGFMRTSRTETVIYDDFIVMDINTLLSQIDDMKTATKNANQAAAAADAAAEHAPYINADNHHWMAWDKDAGAYVDTGVEATGPKGDAGSTPYIGSNGNWWIGSTDTGTKAQGPAGQNGTGSGTVTAVTVKGVRHEPDQTGNVNLGDLGGDGTVNSVNGEAPDESGNVQLDAEKVGARPNTWTPSAEDVGAATADHTHTASDVGAATADHSHTASDVGAATFTLLWENASKGSSFAKQTINIDLSAYDLYIVMAKFSTDIGGMITATVRVGNHARLTGVGASENSSESIRSVNYSNGALEFGNAIKNGSQDNTMLIPIFVYGIKGGAAL